MRLELITRGPEGPAYPTPILFVHGAWHGAWCWDEHFLPYFAQQGFVAHALSWRNHGQSDHAGSLRWKSIAQYTQDVAQVARQLDRQPVVVGHSLGGFVVQQYLEEASVPAAVLLASVPPRGTIPLGLRLARRHPGAFIQANVQLRMGPVVGTPELTHDAFFSKDMPKAHVHRHFAQIQDESFRAFLDVLALDLPRVKRIGRVPMLVLGAADDTVITPAEVRATARAYRAKGKIFPHMAHDMMLEAGWQAVADYIIAWLKSVPGVC